MFGLGIQELLIVLVIVMILFGAKRLPELADGMGKAIRNFRKASSTPDELDLTARQNISADSTAGKEKRKAAV